MRKSRPIFVFFSCCCLAATLLLPAVAAGLDDDSLAGRKRCEYAIGKEKYKSPLSVQGSYKLLVATQSLHELYVDDQLDRKQFQKRSGWQKLSLKEVTGRDAIRIQQVKSFAKSHYLKTPRDFYEAAMILQHGKVADDFLLAHILASAAAFRGHKNARWLSAASLDRYLQHLGKAQIFGTQFRTLNAEGERSIWTMDLLDQELLTDEVRVLYGVPPLSVGVARLTELNGINESEKPVSRSVVVFEKGHPR